MACQVHKETPDRLDYQDLRASLDLEASLERVEHRALQEQQVPLDSKAHQDSLVVPAKWDHEDSPDRPVHPAPEGLTVSQDPLGSLVLSVRLDPQETWDSQVHQDHLDQSRRQENKAQQVLLVRLVRQVRILKFFSLAECFGRQHISCLQKMHQMQLTNRTCAHENEIPFESHKSSQKKIFSL